MMLIEQGYDLWSGDVPWLVAQSIVMIQHGLPTTEQQIQANQILARKLLDTNTGTGGNSYVKRR